jgi:protein gp37
MSDLFHEAIPDEFIGRAFCVMAEASQHIFQILTKRHERMRALLSSLPLSFPVGMIAGDTLDNVWIGVSVENQEQADKRIPILLQTPAAVRFLSVEPLLGPVQLSQYLEGWDTETGRDRQGDPYPVQVQTHKIDWVIVGGESGGGGDRRLVQTEWHGKNAYLWVPKPTAVEWVRSIRDQCVAAGVPFFFKQWGGHTPKSGGRLLDGREWNEFPGRAR